MIYDKGGSAVAVATWGKHQGESRLVHVESGARIDEHGVTYYGSLDLR